MQLFDTPFRKVMAGFGFLAVVLGIFLAVQQAQQPQNLRQEAKKKPSITPTQAVSPTLALTITPTAGVSTVGAGSCPVQTARCSWSAATGTSVSYVVTVTDITIPTAPVKIVDKQAVTQTSLTFPAQPGKKYTCEVVAKNTCGTGDSASSSAVLCPIVTLTPTPTSTPSATSTVTPRPTVTPLPTATPTPTPTPTTIPSPTPRPTVVLTPTTPVVIVTPTTPPVAFVPTSTPVPTKVIAQATPIPTIPPTGDISATIIGGTVAAFMAIIGALAFFML